MTGTSRDRPVILQARGLSRMVGAERRLFQDLSFTVRAGEALWIQGPSGAGKSLLLRGLVRLVPRAEGEVLFRQRSHLDWPAVELRRRMMYLHQRVAYFPGTARENVTALSDARGEPPPDPEIVARFASALGLDPQALDRDASSMSGGELTRLGLLRLLVHAPDVLLLDEPFASLDPATARRVADVLEGWLEEGDRAVIGVTHTLDPLGPSPRTLRLGEEAPSGE